MTRLRGALVFAVWLGALFLLMRAWSYFSAARLAAVWWALYLAAFLAFFGMGLAPVRDRKVRRRLTFRGRLLWGLLCCLLAFVWYWYDIHTNPFFFRHYPWLWALSGLLLLGLFLFFALRIGRRHASVEPLPIILPAPGGGFLLRFVSSPRLASRLQKIPGARRQPESGEWTVPATTESAQALLALARRHGIEFEPRPAFPRVPISSN
jgi:hypothetical protein